MVFMLGSQRGFVLILFQVWGSEIQLENVQLKFTF